MGRPLRAPTPPPTISGTCRWRCNPHDLPSAGVPGGLSHLSQMWRAASHCCHVPPCAPHNLHFASDAFCPSSLCLEEVWPEGQSLRCGGRRTVALPGTG